jgi:predicted nucleic acid-binding Zn ribbon protein
VRLVRLWPEVVGEMIARRTEVTGLKFHTAVVKVSGAMWIQELNLMKRQILERLRVAMGTMEQKAGYPKRAVEERWWGFRSRMTSAYSRRR